MNVNVGVNAVTVKLTLLDLVTPPSVYVAVMVVVPAFIPVIVAIFLFCFYVLCLMIFMSKL